MSGNESELPDESDSTRLSDRAASEFSRRRAQAAEGSTRLRDTASSAFQRRKQQAERAQEAVEARTGEFASALDLAPGQVEPVQLDDRGEEIGFVPTGGGIDALGEQFASERPFVEPGDALVEANPREGVETMVAPEARDEVGQRAREEFASEDPFAEPGDFEADVGPGGVQEAGFTPQGERRRVSRQFESETALDMVDPSADIQPADGGFQLNTGARRRLAARQFEDDVGLFGQGSLDPESDVRQTDDGFGLGRGPARRLAARNIDQQVESVDVGPDDITLELTDGGFEGSFEQEVNR